MGDRRRSIGRVVALALAVPLALAGTAQAQAPEPEVLDPGIAVSTIVSGLNQPVSMAFLGSDEFLVLEKATGLVQHVEDGEVTGARHPRRPVRRP